MFQILIFRGGGPGEGCPCAGRRGQQQQPAGAAPAGPDQQEEGGHREKAYDAGDEPQEEDGAAAGPRGVAGSGDSGRSTRVSESCWRS